MEIASMIDHTLLKAEASKEQIKKLCEEAKKAGADRIGTSSGISIVMEAKKEKSGKN